MRRSRRAWLVAGLVTGVVVVLGSAIVTLVNLARVSDIQGGLRQATVTEGMEDDVDATLGSASLTALLVPPGILMAVGCALALAGENRRLARRRPTRSSD